MSVGRVVHFENCVSTSDEHGIVSANEPFNESATITENHTNNDGEKRKRKTDRWRSVTRSIQSAICIQNSVQPAGRRRKTIWKSSSNDNIDPFIQKFSTRSDNRKTTPPKRLPKPSHKITIENNLQTIREPFDRKESDAFSDDGGYQGSLFSRLVFDPEGHFIYTWSYFVVFAIRYNLWVLILRIAFSEAQSVFRIMWMVFDYICDFIYLVDMLISLRTGYLDEGILVIDKSKIALSYIKSNRFAFDILSLIPTDFIHIIYAIDLPLVRLNRLLKSYKSLTIKNIMESHTNYPTFYRVFFLLHLMFLLINWNAGIYFMISRAEGFGTNQWVYPGNGSLYQQYFKSLYWSTLTLTAIGDLPSPATNYEYVYTIACYLCGVFMFATIVGNAGSIIVNRNAIRMDFERQRESTKSYMQKNKVPKDLQRRVLMWYDYTWNRGRVGNSSYDLNALTLLPDKLKTEIALHVNLETLSKVTFLQKCQPEFLHDLVLKMKLRIFTPGDYICRSGEVAREMYVIINGKIEVVGERGQVLKVLSGGDFFGEIGILSLSEGQNKRTADIRTVGYVECFVLSKEDVLNATRDYPEAQAVLAEYGRRRLEGQTTCKDPRLVDMEDCKPSHNSSHLATNGVSPIKEIMSGSSLLQQDHHYQSPQQRPYQLHQHQHQQPRIARTGLLDPLPSHQNLSQTSSLESFRTIESDSHTNNNSDEYDVILKLMTSSYHDVINHVKETWKRKVELTNKELEMKLLSLREELVSKNENVERMKELLSNQETELEAWRGAVHELEEKRIKDHNKIETLGQELEILKNKLEGCSCNTRRGKKERMHDTKC